MKPAVIKKDMYKYFCSRLRCSLWRWNKTRKIMEVATKRNEWHLSSKHLDDMYLYTNLDNRYIYTTLTLNEAKLSFPQYFE